jgi:hypothetical protein
MEHLVPGDWYNVTDNHYVTGKGMVFGCFDDSVKLGFGVRLGVTPSEALLQEIDCLCGQSAVGHVWLAAGSDNDHWSSVWGVKIRFGWCDLEGFKQSLFDCLAGHQALHEMVDARLAPFGGLPWWSPQPDDDLSPQAKGLALCGAVFG